jgi:hypothetical protein
MQASLYNKFNTVIKKLLVGFCLPWAWYLPHPFIPSPARLFEKTELYLAGEGNKRERGPKPPLEASSPVAQTPFLREQPAERGAPAR